MKTTKYPVDKIIQILAEADLPGRTVAEICRKYSIGRSTFDKWKQRFKGLSSDEARRLKVLEDENLRLKRILAEKELEIQVLNDILKKNF
jgi:putative transposase